MSSPPARRRAPGFFRSLGRGLHRDIPEVDVEVIPPMDMQATERRLRPAEPTQRTPDPGGATCEIALWRGYRKASFYARTYSGGNEVAIGESPSFRPQGKGDPQQTETAVRAHKALCDALLAAGWVRVAGGATWYGSRFQAPLRAPAVPAPGQTPP